MISFEKVTKKFPTGNSALHEVSFEIENNEFVFLVGPSGAGKTTILKLILREFAPTSGEIIIDDFNVSQKNFNQILTLRRTISFVFQDFKVLPDKNIFENVSLGLQVLNTPSNTLKEEVVKALTFVNLQDKQFFFPIQLSAGELQRVAIARAITGNRRYILADEPTGNLDPKTTWDILKILNKLEGKKTIIIATHNTDVVNSLRKRVIVLKSGSLIKDMRKGGYEL